LIVANRDPARNQKPETVGIAGGGAYALAPEPFGREIPALDPSCLQNQ